MFKVSKLQMFKSSELQTLKDSKLHSCLFSTDIGCICNLFKNVLDGSSAFFGPVLSTNSKLTISKMLRFPKIICFKNDSGSFLNYLDILVSPKLNNIGFRESWSHPLGPKTMKMRDSEFSQNETDKLSDDQNEGEQLYGAFGLIF